MGAKKDRFRIKEFSNPSGEIVYRVDGYKSDGKRVRENFETHAEALGRKQELETESINIKTEIQVKRTRLTDSQLLEAESAFSRLAGKSLSDAVEFYLKNYTAPKFEKLLSKAVEEFLIDKENGGLRPDSVRNLRGRLSLFVKQHDGKLVSDISGAAVKAFLERPLISIRNSNNDRAVLNNFFNWASTKENPYCANNPTTKTPKKMQDKPRPKILPLDEAKKLLNLAAGFKDGSLVPYVALSVFCGLRPTELSKLKWSKINLKARVIKIDADVAKTRHERDVTISKNCVEWLKPHHGKTPIKSLNWRKDFDWLKIMAGYGSPSKENPNLKRWVQDILRHTAISFYQAKIQHEGKTAIWAGNSAAIIEAHYRARIDHASHVNAFWSIPAPSTKGKIISLKQAA